MTRLLSTGWRWKDQVCSGGFGNGYRMRLLWFSAKNLPFMSTSESGLLRLTVRRAVLTKGVGFRRDGRICLLGLTPKQVCVYINPIFLKVYLLLSERKFLKKELQQFLIWAVFIYLQIVEKSLLMEINLQEVKISLAIINLLS